MIEIAGRVVSWTPLAALGVHGGTSIPLSDHIIPLEISGLGIICYSPDNAAHIPPGSNYLLENYRSVQDVQRHVQKGSIVGFGTGSPGRFLLHLRPGYPSPSIVEQCPFRLRLAVCCKGQKLVFRDLYSLLKWDPAYDPDHAVSLLDGSYHLTLLTSYPPSGVLGENQVIYVYLQLLDQFPLVAVKGIPTLCS